MDNLIMRGGRFIMPWEVRPDILAAAHEGHPGIVSMLRQLGQSVLVARDDRRRQYIR